MFSSIVGISMKVTRQCWAVVGCSFECVSCFKWGWAAVKIVKGFLGLLTPYSHIPAMTSDPPQPIQRHSSTHSKVIKIKIFKSIISIHKISLDSSWLDYFHFSTPSLRPHGELLKRHEIHFKWNEMFFVCCCSSVVCILFLKFNFVVCWNNIFFLKIT